MESLFVTKKIKKSRNMSVYTNLAHNRKTKKDTASRKKAEYLSSLPKNPLKRIIYRLHPKRFFGYWFSKKGAFMALKIIAVSILLVVLAIGSLFAYYRKDLDAIRPGELSKRVQTTVTKYYDRNDQLLWEDKGSGDYKLVVEGENINLLMKQATIAIEDQDFYKHSGVSPTGIARSLVNNAGGGSIQGGSTLTQQLVKQVFFPPDEQSARGIAGIPRKIKEIILAIEVERMYDKEQILTLYLNESPYGGRRNGVESGAQTYFGKSSKDLTLAESALLAAIPNQPGLYDPYNIEGNESLISRQHKVINSMLAQGYISQEAADEAIKLPILDTIKPQQDQFVDMQAPHFVQMVKTQLEQELGKATVGKGGLNVKTTLDIRIQKKTEESIATMFASNKPVNAGFTNGAATVEDTQTGQIIALVGSRDYNYPGFGQDNAATAYIQPGSTIKPLVYAQLFSQQPSNKQNYGSGSILTDANDFAQIYGAPLRNADGRYMGSINLRKSLALSRNVPAVKAMYISGQEATMKTIHELGNSSYCTQGADKQAGLSSAIGGCGNKQIDLVNAFASLAREGVYKPTTTILEVKNSGSETIKVWKDESKKVLDPQAAYIVSDILADDNARSGLYGRNFYGLVVPGVKTATKTGTSDKDGKAKDIWTISYSPAITMGVWLGNPDTQILKNGNSSIPAVIIGDVMAYAHKDVYQNEGKWKPGNWFSPPTGLQTINGELFPSYYNKNKAQSNAKMTFDKVSKKKATACTPEDAKIEIDITKTIDPITNKEVTSAPDGYDPTKDDDAHICSDAKPTISSIEVGPKGSGSGGASSYKITVNVLAGKAPVKQVDITVDGAAIALPSGSGSAYVTSYTPTGLSTATIDAVVLDELYYRANGSTTFKPSS